MTRELFNVAELIAAALVGGFVVGVAVFLATAWMRQEAFADRADAAADLADARAAQIAMEASRSRLVLAPAYAADTVMFATVVDDEPFDCAPECRCHADEPGPNSIRQTEGIPAVGTDLVPVGAVLVDEPPVTADDLAPIGPDQMPRLTFWGRVALGAALLPLLVALVLLALAVLARVGWDRAGEWRADRSRRRETEPVEMELAHPAPADAYPARHRAPAGRWWWSR